MTAALSAAVRHGVFPAVTLLTTVPSIGWMRDWGLGQIAMVLILLGCAGLYLLSARTAPPYDAADALSRWMPSGVSMTICAGVLALFAAALLVGAL